MSDNNNVTISRGEQPLTDQEVALVLTQSWLNNQGNHQDEEKILTVYEKALKKIRDLNE